MKILKINYVSEKYLEYFYTKYKDSIQDMNYEEHLSFLLKDGFSAIGTWSRNLLDIGVDAKEIIINDKILLSKLSNELKSQKDNFDNLLTVIVDFSPDVVIFSNPTMLDTDKLDKIKNIASVKKMIAWHCAPMSKMIEKRLRYYDFILTCTPGFLEIYKQIGIKSYLIYHSFDTTNDFNLSSEKKNELLFIGSLWLYNEVDWHIERMHFLNNIAKEIEASYYLSIRRDSFLKANIKRILYNINKYTPLSLSKVKGYENTPKYINIPRYIRDSVKNDSYFGKAMIERLSKSTMALNFHVGAAGEYAGNIRLFEVTGAETCLITDKKKNINDLFEDEKEIIVYENQDDCIEKIKYLYENPEIAIEIGQNAKKRVLKEHTTKHRMKQLVEILKNEL